MARMTVKEARLIFSTQARIIAALDRCLKGLGQDERGYAESYWATHIRNIAMGHGHGVMPISQADEVLDAHDNRG